MKLKYFLPFLVLIFFNIFPALAIETVEPAEAQIWAKNKGEEILRILSSQDLEYKYKSLDQIMENDIDLDHAARFVVGKYWRQMTKDQQQQYVPLFKKYLSNAYKTFPLNLEKGAIDFKIEKALKAPAGTEVFCTIFIKKVEQSVDEKSKGGIHVIFTLTKNNQKIQVRDLKVEESSLLMSLRDRFYKMIHVDSDDEIDWFLEDFATLVDDTEEKNEQTLYDFTHKM